MSVLSGRALALSAALKESGCRVYFAQDPLTMRYLTGFGEDAHERFLVLAVSDDQRMALICPALSANQAARCGISDIRPWKDGEDPSALAAQLIQDWSLQSGAAAVDDAMKAASLLLLQKQAPQAQFIPGGAIIASQMRIKDPSELKLLRQAAEIADLAYEAALPQIRVGQTERQVQSILYKEMEARGGRPKFGIVAAGAGGAEPHHESDDTQLSSGNVVILDFGCEFGGYQSDITRVIAIGSASDEAKAAYRLVFDAHMAGRKAAGPGAAAGDVDRAARDVIEAGGMGEFFYHRLGHGIGMNGHEEPYIAPGSSHALLPGECFSIEPGVYLAGQFGIRIENIVTVTESGCESLNAEPAPELTIV